MTEPQRYSVDGVEHAIRSALDVLVFQGPILVSELVELRRTIASECLAAGSTCSVEIHLVPPRAPTAVEVRVVGVSTSEILLRVSKEIM